MHLLCILRMCNLIVLQHIAASIRIQHSYCHGKALNCCINRERFWVQSNAATGPWTEQTMQISKYYGIGDSRKAFRADIGDCCQRVFVGNKSQWLDCDWTVIEITVIYSHRDKRCIYITVTGTHRVHASLCPKSRKIHRDHLSRWFTFTAINIHGVT